MKEFMALWNNGSNMMKVTSENKEDATRFFNLATLGATDLVVYEILELEEV